MAVLQDFKRPGIQKGLEVKPSFFVTGICFGEEMVIQPHFSGDGMRCRHPVECRFDLAAVRCISSSGLGVISAMHFRHSTRVVLHHMDAFDEIGVAESHLAAWCEPVKLLGWSLHEVVFLDEELP